MVVYQYQFYTSWGSNLQSLALSSRCPTTEPQTEGLEITPLQYYLLYIYFNRTSPKTYMSSNIQSIAKASLTVPDSTSFRRKQLPYRPASFSLSQVRAATNKQTQLNNRKAKPNRTILNHKNTTYDIPNNTRSNFTNRQLIHTPTYMLTTRNHQRWYGRFVSETSVFQGTRVSPDEARSTQNVCQTERLNRNCDKQTDSHTVIVYSL